MNYLATAIITFSMIRLLVAVSNMLTRQWLRPGSTATGQPLVSVLIPARNEAHQIGRLLEDLMDQDHPNWEAIVYNDLSEDDTESVVRHYMNKDNRIRLISGEALPPGWLGKNHGCHRLAAKAGGGFLLFLDADVRLGKTALGDALAHREKFRLDLLSVFPRQKMNSFGEKISVPLMNWVLLSLLPLILTRKTKLPSLAAANGQFMLFNAVVYKRHLFHQQFRKKPAEDIAIAREMKKKGFRIHTILGGRQVECRMYPSLAEAMGGFSKNVIDFFGSSFAMAILFTLLTTFGFIPVYLAMGPVAMAGLLIMTLAIRGITAGISRQQVIINIATAPLQQAIFAATVVLAIYRTIRKTNTWKGRSVNI